MDTDSSPSKKLSPFVYLDAFSDLVLIRCFLDLPGYTRSVYKRDHALITPESHVYSPLPDWYMISFSLFL